MRRRALARLAAAPPTLLGISLVTFALVHLAPGDAAVARGGETATPSTVAERRHALGLDRPLATRYLEWLSRSARLDFGASFVDGRSVRERIGEALPRTAAVAGLAALLALAVAVPLGAWSASRSALRRARVVDGALALAYALPTVALALLLLRAGAPYGGGAAWPAAACLAVPSLVVLARHQRAAVAGALGADLSRTARAKGLGEWGVLRHALRATLAPLVTLLGTQVPLLLSGSVVVEEVFGVRGIGLLGFEAVLARDVPVVLGLTTLGAALSLGGALVADAAAMLLDPRLRDAGAPP